MFCVGRGGGYFDFQHVHTSVHINVPGSLCVDLDKRDRKRHTCTHSHAHTHTQKGVGKQWGARLMAFKFPLSEWLTTVEEHSCSWFGEQRGGNGSDLRDWTEPLSFNGLKSPRNDPDVCSLCVFVRVQTCPHVSVVILHLRTLLCKVCFFVRIHERTCV